MKYYKTSRYVLSILVLVCLYGINLVAQPRNISFEKLTVEDGLINSTVKVICEDSFGFIWFGTKNGICRYDGVNFRYYTSDVFNNNSLPDNYIVSISEYGSKLFIGTYSGGLSIFDISKETFTNYSFKDSLFAKDYPITVSIFDSVNLHYYFATLGGGVVVADMYLKPIKRYFVNGFQSQSLSNNMVSDLILTDSTLYIATAGNYIDCLDLPSCQIIKRKHSESQLGFYKSFGKRLYLLDSMLFIGTETEKLFQYNIKSKTFINAAKINSTLPDAIITKICCIADNLFISTDGKGLYIYNLPSGKHTSSSYYPNNPTGISSNAIWEIYYSRSGLLWIGTFSAGVNMYIPHKNFFKNIKQVGAIESVLPAASVLDVEYDFKRNSVIIATDGGGLVSFDMDYQKIEPLTDVDIKKTEVVKKVFFDSKGSVLFGTYGSGLVVKKESMSAYKPVIDSLNNKSIWDIEEDSYGNLWFATLYEGLYRFNTITKKVTNYRHDVRDKFSIPADVVNVLFIDNQKQLWIGTDGNGLAKYNYKNDIFERAFSPSPQSGEVGSVIRTIFQDKQSRLFFGTQGEGIRYLSSVHDEVFKHITKNDGLPSNTISDIRQDSLGLLWITTDRGLCSYDFEKKRSAYLFGSRWFALVRI
ncbi:MAG: hypothetical protein IPO21_02025 [Bacteroidales bacterium]|nr:hypothetical protein [Bacteroidales bacterium]